MSWPSSSPIRQGSHIISTHDPKTGWLCGLYSSDALPGNPPVAHLGDMKNILAYSASTFLIKDLSPPTSTTTEVDADSDIKYHAHHVEHPAPPRAASPTGTECRLIEFPPGAEAPMHRTLTSTMALYLECELDSGGTKVLKKGDVIVQRGTAHRGKNVKSSDDNGGWLKIFFVMLAIEKAKVEGRRNWTLDLVCPEKVRPSSDAYLYP